MKDKIKDKTVVKRIKFETPYSETYQVKYKTNQWNEFCILLDLDMTNFILFAVKLLRDTASIYI